MAVGRKTGGRKSGTPNKVTSAVGCILQELGGPRGELYAHQLHALACEPHGDPNVRIKALSLIAPYVWQKLPERQEITGLDGADLVIRWGSTA